MYKNTNSNQISVAEPYKVWIESEKQTKRMSERAREREKEQCDIVLVHAINSGALRKFFIFSVLWCIVCVPNAKTIDCCVWMQFFKIIVKLIQILFYFRSCVCVCVRCVFVVGFSLISDLGLLCSWLLTSLCFYSMCAIVFFFLHSFCVLHQKKRTQYVSMASLFNKHYKRVCCDFIFLSPLDHRGWAT